MYKILNNLQVYKNNTALMTENNSITYNDLIKKSDKIKKKIKSNTISLMVAQNNLNFITSYIAFLRKKK